MTYLQEFQGLLDQIQANYKVCPECKERFDLLCDMAYIRDNDMCIDCEQAVEESVETLEDYGISVVQ